MCVCVCQIMCIVQCKIFLCQTIDKAAHVCGFPEADVFIMQLTHSYQRIYITSVVHNLYFYHWIECHDCMAAMTLVYTDVVCFILCDRQ